MDMIICRDGNARCGNLLVYLEDKDIRINNMSLNETDNIHVEHRSKDKVINNYGKTTKNALHQFQCIYSEWA